MNTELSPPVRPPPPRNLLDDLLEVDVPDGLALNRAGERLAYHTRTKWNNHPHGEDLKSSIWVAAVGKEKSARRLTNGTEYHDHSPQWSPDGRCIFFLSNRRTRGNIYSIYYVDVDLVLSGGTVDIKDDFFDDFDDPFYLALNHATLGRYNSMRPPDFGRSGDGLQVDPDDQPTDTLRELPDAKDCCDIVKFEMCPQWSSSGGSRLVFLGLPRYENNTDFDNDGLSVRFAAPLRNLGKRFADSHDVVLNKTHYATTARNLMSPQQVRDGYVVDVTWSGGGQRTIAVTRPSADPDSAELGGSTFWVETSSNNDFAERVFHVPLAIAPGSLAWVGQHVYFLSWNVANDASSGLAVNRLDTDASIARMRAATRGTLEWSPGGTTYTDDGPQSAAEVDRNFLGRCRDSDNACTKVIMGGEECCPCSFKAVRGPRPGDGSSDDVLVHMQQSTEEKLVLVREKHTLFASEKAILDYAAINVGTDGNRNNTKTVLVVVQGDINHPSEVFALDPSTGDLVQLSDHGGAFLAKQQQGFGTPSWIECSVPVRTGNDSVTIDALLYSPVACCQVRPVRRGFGANFWPFIYTDNVVSGSDAAPASPYPTVIFVHDGPYSRATNGFDRRASEPDLAEILAPLLLRAGIAVLQPNCRGGSGRGARFASLGSTRAGGLGRHDVSDIIALTDTAVKQGLANPASLFTIGWSHGGYLAYMMALRNSTLGLGWRFQGAVCGAAVSDWYSLALTSSEGYHYGTLSEHIPWREDNNPENSSPSPLRELADAAREGRLPPRLLILHGEADTLVPVSQAEGVRRSFEGTQYVNSIVTYPGQGHFFEKRASVRDMLQRIVKFVCEPLHVHVDDSIFDRDSEKW